MHLCSVKFNIRYMQHLDLKSNMIVEVRVPLCKYHSIVIKTQQILVKNIHHLKGKDCGYKIIYIQFFGRMLDFPLKLAFKKKLQFSTKIFGQFLMPNCVTQLIRYEIVVHKISQHKQSLIFFIFKSALDSETFRLQRAQFAKKSAIIKKSKIFCKGFLTKRVLSSNAVTMPQQRTSSYMAPAYLDVIHQTVFQ